MSQTTDSQPWTVKGKINLVLFVIISGTVLGTLVWYMISDSNAEECKVYQKYNPKNNQCEDIRIIYIEYDSNGIIDEKRDYMNEGVIKEKDDFIIGSISLTNGYFQTVKNDRLYNIANVGDYVVIDKVTQSPHSCFISKIWLSNKTQYTKAGFSESELRNIENIFPASVITEKNDFLHQPMCGESKTFYQIVEIKN